MARPASVPAPADLGIDVIGVTKSHFATATHAIEVGRGSGTKPLYLTAAGRLAPASAAEIVAAMAAGTGSRHH